ncbi:MAG: hypothetical protein UU34_C0001G0031 [Candidatus Curtissbacteria bacterium GW2011_GWA1_41_11]|uniref:Uncharacterized protein n=1 Tax=Candidatus Curtissbacteria bacterium GW2011_GWA1_41_11 TaxID=1618409 RepID=A0A0G0UGN7_9BACT|nr:MAG: hypothetical protein UU34_C0001G0031 [Candidatus Curtissbacteria bacterium GW2011_GWA1_41_11]
MTERNSSAINLEPQIEVVTKNDEGTFLLEGTVKGARTFLALSAKDAPQVLTSRLNGQYPILRRQYYGQPLIISHSENFQLHDSLKPSQSADLGSETEYAGQTPNKEIALQIVKQLRTSRPAHNHDGQEFYHYICGRLAIRTLDLASGERAEEILCAEKPLVVVPEGYIHQVRAIEAVAISVLVCDFTKHDYHPNLSLFG